MSQARCPLHWLVEASRDGRVVGAERAAFEKHISICIDCAENSRRACAAREKLSELPSGLPDAFTVRRQRRELLRSFNELLVADNHAQSSRAGRWVAAAALAVAGLLGVWLFRRASAPQSWVEVVANPGDVWHEEKTTALDRVTLLKGRFRLSIRRTSPSSRVVLTLPDGEIEDLGTVLQAWTEGTHTSHVSVEAGAIILRIHGLSALVMRAGDHWDQPTPPAPSSPPARSDSTTDASTVPKVALDSRLAAEAPRGPKHNGLTEASPRAPREKPQAQLAGSASSTADPAAEDSAYLRVLELLQAGRRLEAHRAVTSYLALYPHGFRRIEALGIQERLERSP